MNEFEVVKRAYGSGTGSNKPRYLTLTIPDNIAARVEDSEFELREYVKYLCLFSVTPLLT